jgi:hypothetical protein
MQSIICKVKSLPKQQQPSKADEPPIPSTSLFQLSYSQFCQQVNKLDELIDIMIDDSNNDLAIHYPSPPTRFHHE